VVSAARWNILVIAAITLLSLAVIPTFIQVERGDSYERRLC
jgi:hypothetical protein